MNFNFLSACLFLFICTCTGCKKFLDVVPPTTQVSGEEVFANDDKATGLLLAIYPALLNGNASPYTIESLSGLSGDELVNYATDENQSQIYLNFISPANLFSTSFWKDAYSYIYRANDVYLGCSASSKLDPIVKKQLMGEALVIRSYLFFNLTNFFGDIPIAQTSDYIVNSFLPRTLTTKVYEKIITDLKTARDDLSEAYTGPDSKTPANERIRPNKATASALLARVNLYLGRYADAETEATSVINASSIYTLVPLEEVFLKNSAEAIWQIKTPDDNMFNINTHEGANFFLAYPPHITGRSAIQQSLINAFENGDLRKNVWMGSYTDITVNPAKTYYYPYKYKVSSGNDITEYTMILRLAELYLIRAEARIHLSKFSGATDDVNIIRKRAGLPLLPPPVAPVNQTDLLNIILKERQRELFTEQGHRWFDIKRSGNIDAIMNTACGSKGGSWKNAMKYWPVPTNELSLNPKLVQNPGYD
jgi:hypothetical protein